MEAALDEFTKSKEFKHMTEPDAQCKAVEVTMQVLAENETPELAGMVTKSLLSSRFPSYPHMNHECLQL